MILVAGTKRSGTSMWMRILEAAGVPILGERFPRNWEDAPLGEANPEGFYESTLRDGINFATNPDPRTGEYLHPQDTRGHAVKVFLPGLTRTDLAFVEAVVFTMRDWRAYAWSVARLQELERRGQGKDPRTPAPTFVHVLEWWTENFQGLRDLLMRRYSCHVLTYASVLAQPEGTVRETLAWLGLEDADVEAAVAVVDPANAATMRPAVPEDTPEDLVPIFDALYERVHTGVPFDPEFLQLLNETNTRLAPLVYEHLRQARLHRKHVAETA